MNIILNPEQQRFIEEKLSSGNYRSIDEIIVEALRLLEERGKHYESRRKILPLLPFATLINQILERFIYYFQI